MPDLNDTPEDSGAVHLLLIAPTKTGKSTYVAESAVSGYDVIYLDGDNGLSALRATINKQPNAVEINKRVHYFPLTHIRSFLQGFLKSNNVKPLKWVPRLNRSWTPALPDVEDSEPVWLLNIKAVPQHFILAVDSWTSVCQDSLRMLRPDQDAPLLDGTDQGVYGEAKALADYLNNMLQQVHCHVIVQAHPTRYEIYDKPKNVIGGLMKQKDMTLIETIEVPISTSRASGLDMGKQYNHIGWLEVTATGTVNIDFTRKPNRVGGGPPNRKDKTSVLNFDNLVRASNGAVPAPIESDTLPWYIATTHGELKAAGAKA